MAKIQTKIPRSKNTDYSHVGDSYTIWTEMTSGVNGYQFRKEMLYLMTHSTHFIYGYMASDIF